jgi:membrane-associated phospholipid phosphatase
MDAIAQFELTISPFFQSLGAWLTPVMKFFSFLGTEQFFLVIIPLLFWCVDSRLGLRIAVMLILTNTVKPALKMAFHWPRPYWVDPGIKALAPESSFGMPSGHAQDAASLWGLLAVTLRRRWVTAAAIFVILMIGLSRIYLGVHFAHDVLGGWAVGIILVALFTALERPVSAWFARMNFGGKSLVALGTAAVILLIGYGVRLSLGGWSLPQEWVRNAALQWPDQPINPLDLEGFITIAAIAFGMIFGLGLLLLTRTSLRTAGSWLQRVGRYLIGMVGLLALYLGLRMVFPTEPEALGQVFRFARYALIGVWVTFGAPWVFVRLRLM